MPKISPGCFNCRRRKVKCDEGKPHCRRCINLGVECEGYRTNAHLEFRDQTRHYWGKGPRRKSSLASPPVLTPVTDVPSTPSLAASLIPAGSGDVSPSPFDITSAPQRRLALVTSFLDLYLPNSEFQTRVTADSFLAFLPDLDQMDIESPLSFALCALSAATLGTVNRTQRLLDDSRLLYSTALQRLCVELEHPEVQVRDETLLTVLILALCEHVEPTNSSGSGWIAHIKGARNILSYRTHAAHGSYLAALMYHKIFMGTFHEHVSLRQSLDLERPTWLDDSIPGSEKDPFVQLVGLMSQIPGLLQLMDSSFVPNDERSTAQNVSFALEGFRVLQQRLRYWFADTSTQIPGPWYELVDVDSFEAFKSLGLDRVFPLAYKFPGFYHAYLLGFYWVSMLLISWNATSLVHLAKSYLIEVDIGEDFEDKSVDYAASLCQCIPYCWDRQVSCWFGRVYSVTLLHYTEPFFTQTGHLMQQAWCAEMFRQIRATGICPPLAMQTED